MRFNLSSNIGKVLMAALLASAATGCSSDSQRFAGLFQSSDQVTTGSIPRRNMSGLDGDPVPRENVASGAQYQQGNGNMASNQPYPSAPARYNPSYSSARVASAPVAVQRSELAAPSMGSSPAPVVRNAERQAAMAQPFPATRGAPAHDLAPPRLAPDPMSTGTTPDKVSGWSAMNAPSVTLHPGETTAILSRRFGVPEKEILKANNLKSSAAAMPGQTIIIPTFNGGSSSAKAASEAADLSKGGKVPAPVKAPVQDAAVLPGNGALRDKSQLSAQGAGGKLAAGSGKGPTPTGGTYVVKQGDSLAKIAKATGAHIDDLKQANDIGKGGIHIGQTLKLPHGATAPVDQVKTASIATEKGAAEQNLKTPATAPSPKVQTAAIAPVKAQAAPVATQSVDDAAEKSDVASVAPEATGIGKYRWPVRGAVIAAYGANVEGSRNDGIDISVPQGTPIKAAENGVVIYAGNGLKELGNTVLLRHDDGTVTVYGHADALSVARGQKVQRGQTLATSGMSGNAKQPQLHFEVRKNASPVNPMTFLE
ncbi:peptidoglycan DD-metalloendopeptidase family protein [Rhizobium sp. 2YAF20]|uniref:peptidoglycan DD-metalloendopeptidase family protein n=1 Tax=Rhizobium sp. 2YAF20 TaxID=3233027 RepID=UPI003F9DFBEF